MVRLDDGNIMDKISIAAERFRQMPKQTLELIKNTVAQDATEEELALFLYMASHYGLDPLLGEIYFAKIPKRKGGKPEPTYIVSRDGYLKAAMRNPGYQGLNSFVVREGDIFEIDAEKAKVIHKFGTKRGKILGAWAIAYRKGYTPCVAFVDFKEYAKPENFAWRKYPSAMIQKVAEVFVLRRQFNISGIYIKEELDAATNNVQEIRIPAKEKLIQVQGVDGAVRTEKEAKPVDKMIVDTIPLKDEEPETTEEPETNESEAPEIYNQIIDELNADNKNITKGTIVMLAMRKLKAGEITQEDVTSLKKYISDKYK